MMAKRLISFLWLVLFFQFNAFGQFVNCGKLNPAGIENEGKIQHKKPGVPAIDGCLNKTLSLRFLIVMDEFGSAGVNPSMIDAAIVNLNFWFAPICLSFTTCEIDTVYANKFDKWDGNEEAEFKVLYAKRDIINIAVISEANSDVGSFAPVGVNIPSDHMDLLGVEKSGLDAKPMVHAMGHLLGLYDTHFTGFGNELVNGANCGAAGDLLCDTPADLSSPVFDSLQFCSWNETSKDLNGDLYTPIIGNFMSAHPFSCPGSFTIQQYNRMIFCYKNFRSYLY